MSMNEKEIWDKALVGIECDISSKIGFNTYIAAAVPYSYNNGIFRLYVDSPLCRNMIKARYIDIIERHISAVTGNNVTLEIVIEKEIDTPAENKIEEKPAAAPVDNNIGTASSVNTASSSNTSLNPRFTFESFVVGPAQKVAYAAAQNVAKQPGLNFNPMFLYGRSGLGKTHLMHAIGNEILRLHPEKKVLYVTSEKFTNDLINSISEKNTEAFRQKYRDVDALLIDDIQFIEKKATVQEEFFHTFNELYSKNKQIVIISDRKPKDLVVLDERLRNRFGGGYTIDIMMPDFETRVAILQNKAKSQNSNISNDVLQYIAQHINTNIRELEGALCKLTAYAGISGQKIDIPLAEHVLSDIFPENIKITTDKIIEKVTTYYNITVEEIKGKVKTKNIAFPRQVAMYLCKNLTDLNYAMIGIDFGNKDRTTVMHNVDKITEQLKSDQKLKADIEFIKNDLQSL